MIGFRAIASVCLVVGALGLASCGDDASQSKTGAGSSASQADTKRQDTDKYNHYVGAANLLSKPFSDGLGSYEKYLVPALASQKPLESYWVVNDTFIDPIKKRLDTALAMPNPMPEIDSAARDYAQALGQLSPLSHELESYAAAKTFLSDKGAMAREKGPAYHAALRGAVAAEEAFNAAIAKQDMINIKTSFDKQQPGSINYFKAGILYRSKLSIAAAEAFFSDPDSAETRAAFKASLDEVGTMVTGLDEKLRAENADPARCRDARSEANRFLAAGRTSLDNAEKGRYKKDRGPIASSMQRINYDASDVQRAFNGIISAFNQRDCLLP